MYICLQIKHYKYIYRYAQAHIQGKAATEFNYRVHLSSFISPFIFSFRVKLPWILFSSDSIVRPPISASRWVRFTMPMPKTMRVTCCGSEVTRLRFLCASLPLSCSFSNTTLQAGSVGLRTPTKTQISNLRIF